jgi:hypothetical protein
MLVLTLNVLTWMLATWMHSTATLLWLLVLTKITKHTV